MSAENIAENIAEKSGEEAEESLQHTLAVREQRRNQEKAELREAKRAARSAKRARHNENVAFVDGMMSLLKGFVGILLLVRVVYALMGYGENFNTATMLEVLQNAPVVDPRIMLNLVEFTIQGNWGLLDPLRDFLNFFPAILNLLITLVSMLWNVLIYVWYFIRILFGNNGI